ncbi:MAG: hypothetical protein HYV28_02390, partial [Ignavibacteriales bacterium]|nr:hypothetical protein [Ignavibacteriales bacterium]
MNGKLERKCSVKFNGILLTLFLLITFLFPVYAQDQGEIQKIKNTIKRIDANLKNEHCDTVLRFESTDGGECRIYINNNGVLEKIQLVDYRETGKCITHY